jgi:hypothetical protein
MKTINDITGRAQPSSQANHPDWMRELVTGLNRHEFRALVRRLGGRPRRRITRAPPKRDQR